MTDPFQKKTWGRIFIQESTDPERIIAIIRFVDSFEADYMPKDLIAVYRPDGKNQLVHLHKFEMDKIALMRACLAKGIWIWCVDGFREFDLV